MVLILLKFVLLEDDGGGEGRGFI